MEHPEGHEINSRGECNCKCSLCLNSLGKCICEQCYTHDCVWDEQPEGTVQVITFRDDRTGE